MNTAYGKRTAGAGAWPEEGRDGSGQAEGETGRGDGFLRQTGVPFGRRAPDFKEKRAGRSRKHMEPGLEGQRLYKRAVHGIPGMERDRGGQGGGSADREIFPQVGRA